MYGPVRSHERDDLWLELLDIKVLWDILWCLGGDFNAIRFSHEKRGASRITRSMRGFNKFVNDYALVNPPLLNATFTWSNFQDLPSCNRLDRFLFNCEWEVIFGTPSQTLLSRTTSDHSPILLHHIIHRRGPSPFRFENMWLSHPNFHNEIVYW